MKTRLLLMLLLWPALAGAAQPMYVSDQLRITVRTGQGSDHRIIKTLASGDKVEVLETTDTGYTRIRTADGTEGWVRSQYLVEQPIARDRLAQAQARLQQLASEAAALKSRMAELEAERHTLEKDKTGLTARVESLDKALAQVREAAARPLALARENQNLKQHTLQLENDLQLRVRENQVLKDRSQREWFVIGAAVLFAGIVLGLLLPKLRLRRRSGWDI